MILVKNSIPIIVITLLLLPACELMPQDNPVVQEEDPVIEEENAKPESEEYYGVCSMELFDIVDERGFVPIMIDLVMEDYVPRSQLDEDEWREQRKAMRHLF